MFGLVVFFEISQFGLNNPWMEYPSMLAYKSAQTILTLLLISFLTSTASAETGFPLTVTDDFGRNVTVATPPVRIVSTAPSNTEILFALGLGDKVVGVTKYCDWPPLVLERVGKGQISLIGGYADPSLEGVVSLNPDLVLAANDIQSVFVSALQSRGIVVVALNPKNVNDIIRDLALVGTISGKVTEANSLVSNLQHRINYVSDRVSGSTDRPKVYYELWYDPLMSFGSNTLVDELIAKAGGENAFHDAPNMYPTVSSEMVVQKNPDIILVPEGYMGGIARAEFEKRAGWITVKAVKEGKIFAVNENLLVRTGPRISDGLETIASIISSQLFMGPIQYNSSIAVTSNSTIFGIIYDDTRSLLNFTVIGNTGSAANIGVNIEKRLLKGRPIVMVDGVEITTSVSESQNSYSVQFVTILSTHQVVVGGSQTIPEFGQQNISATLVLTLMVVLSIMIFNRTKRGLKIQGSMR